MIKNKSRKILFLEAGIFIVVVYILIIFTTLILDEWRMKELDYQIYGQEIKHQSFLASNFFYEVMGKKDCNFSQKYIFDEYDDIKELSMNIASFKNRILPRNEEKYSLKKREYLVAQIGSLNKLKRHNEICEQKIYPLFYFIDGDITGFNQQALILQQFSKNYKDEIIIYTLDLNYDGEPIIKSLIEIYGVKNHNTIIFGELNNAESGQIGMGRLTQEIVRLRGE